MPWKYSMSHSSTTVKKIVIKAQFAPDPAICNVGIIGHVRILRKLLSMRTNFFEEK